MAFTKTKLTCIICLVILATSCTLTTTKRKDPVFNDMGKVEKELTSLVTSENINLNGKEISTNKKATSELEVSITNGQNIPNSDDEIKSLGKSIATTIKKNLKDPNEFDTYKVLFITKVESGGASKRTWVGNVFSLSEL